MKKYIYAVNNIKITIETNDPQKAAEIEKEITEAIAKSPIYFNDLTAEHWAFDTKLKCGKWLENIKFSDSLRNVKALILF